MALIQGHFFWYEQTYYYGEWQCLRPCGRLPCTQVYRAALQAGHEVHCVFFYQDGVSQSNALCAPASDELDLTAAWQQLAKEWQLNLVNCVSAALRRGVLSAQDAKDNAKASANLAAGFTMGGLASWSPGLKRVIVW